MKRSPYAGSRQLIEWRVYESLAAHLGVKAFMLLGGAMLTQTGSKKPLLVRPT